MKKLLFLIILFTTAIWSRDVILKVSTKDSIKEGLFLVDSGSLGDLDSVTSSFLVYSNVSYLNVNDLRNEINIDTIVTFEELIINGDTSYFYIKGNPDNPNIAEYLWIFKAPESSDVVGMTLYYSNFNFEELSEQENVSISMFIEGGNLDNGSTTGTLTLPVDEPTETSAFEVVFEDNSVGYLIYNPKEYKFSLSLQPNTI